MIKKVRTLQIGNKLIIMNGVDPLRYVDLTTNIVHQYEPVTKAGKKVISFLYKVKNAK